VKQKKEEVKEETEEEKKAKLSKIKFSWRDLCGVAKLANENLSATGCWSASGDSQLTYNNYGVGGSLVEVDVITGEVNTLMSDMVYDCGKSLNPAIDIGQCEGSFLMGLGAVLKEQQLYDENAVLLSDSTFLYHIPCYKDVPLNFNVEFMKDSKWDTGILKSKSTGEPPLVLAVSVAMAVRHAIDSARKDAGLSAFYILDAPFTPDVIQAACGTDENHFSI